MDLGDMSWTIVFQNLVTMLSMTPNVTSKTGGIMIDHDFRLMCINQCHNDFNFQNDKKVTFERKSLTGLLNKKALGKNKTDKVNFSMYNHHNIS